jgi:hypothetical protein
LLREALLQTPHDGPEVPLHLVAVRLDILDLAKEAAMTLAIAFHELAEGEQLLVEIFLVRGGQSYVLNLFIVTRSATERHRTTRPGPAVVRRVRRS